MTATSLQPNTEAWHEARRKTIGASDAPAILGISRYATPYDIWLKKKDLESRHVTPAQEAVMSRGHKLENAVALTYQERMATQVESDAMRVHPDHAWMSATCDRRIFPDMDAPENKPKKDRWPVLEIKTINSATIDRWGDDYTDEVDDMYYVQVQHQLAVTGVEWAHVAACFAPNDVFNMLVSLLDGGVGDAVIARVITAPPCQLRVYRIERDEAFIKRMIAIEEDFYNRHMVGDEEPERDVKHIEPRSKIRQAQGDEIEEIERLRQYRVTLDLAEADYDRQRAKVEGIIGDSAGIESEQGIITWKKTKDRFKTDWEKVAMDVFGHYAADTPADREFIETAIAGQTKSTPGSRMFITPKTWKKEIEQ